MIITPEQIRAARALLRIDQKDLASRANVSVVTVRRMEAEDGLSKLSPDTVNGIRTVLEEAGVEFIYRGVRLEPRLNEEQQALFERIRDITLKSAAELAGGEHWTEADLYDENGLPE
jgi:transcriptional regulator with XRE-family HTH domain